eukprot:TRINITY_DN12202_c0_g1_i1.p1 TRINITY_DN12202_c0_g1~~TRINITY_DN12202_c0_g1_i1.p1  ORF type:complete len:227 (-),score=43.77 TRINITY_DN12202_c0_g1_i1:25-705(-)
MTDYPQEVKVDSLRVNYTRHKQPLLESVVNPEPLHQFQSWIKDALEAKTVEPNAMTFCTSTPDGYPSARMVLLKHFDENGFVFFTNYRSRKSQEIEANPRVSLMFWWDTLQRSVRIEGTIEKASRKESEEYFHSRPRLSQLGAWASSHQSEVIEDRKTLDDAYEEVAKKFEGKEVPCPEFWGGWRVHPTSYEFWQGCPSRLHDRLKYLPVKNDDGKSSWKIVRLSP